MMTPPKHLIIGILATLATASAQDALLAPPARGWCVDNFLAQIDNDLFAKSDRDYTSGVRLAWGGPLFEDQDYDPIRAQLNKLADGSDSLLEKFADTRQDSQQVDAWGLSIAQLMFTPEDYFPRVPPPGERPYAAWLGTDYSVHMRTNNSLTSVGLNVGVTGEWALGEALQDIIHHDLTHSPYFNGWDSEMPEEVTVNLSLDHKRRFRFFDSWTAGPFGVDGYHELGGTAGTFRTSGYGGALVRTGINLRNDYSVPRLQLGSYSNQYFSDTKTPHWFSAYLLGGVRGNLILHDFTLDGSLFQDHRYTVDSKPFVGEIVLGAGVCICSFELLYSRILRSDEFDGQNANQEYGSIQLRWSKIF